MKSWYIHCRVRIINKNIIEFEIQKTHVTLLECHFKETCNGQSQIISSDNKKGSKAIKGTIII